MLLCFCGDDTCIHIMCACAQLLSRSDSFSEPMDCSTPGSFVHGILQAWILEWVADTKRSVSTKRPFFFIFSPEVYTLKSLSSVP